MKQHVWDLTNKFTNVMANRIQVTDDEDWLRRKHKTLGGTDKAILAGISKWNTPVGLFYEKTNEFKMDEDKWNITMERGKYLEPLVVDIYKRTYGSVTSVWHNTNNDLFIHPNYSYMSCTPDGLSLDESLPDVEVLECKSAAGKGSVKWYSGIPEMYLVQLHSNIDVMNLNYGCLAWIVDDIPGTIRVEKDKELCDAMNYMAERFWNDNVLANIPPDPQTVDDYKKIYRNAVPQSVLQCTEALYETINEYLLIKEMIKDYKSQTSMLESREQDLCSLIRKGMKENESLEYRHEVIATLKLSKNGVRRLNINSKIINSFKENNHDS